MKKEAREAQSEELQRRMQEIENESIKLKDDLRKKKEEEEKAKREKKKKSYFSWGSSSKSS